MRTHSVRTARSGLGQLELIVSVAVTLIAILAFSQALVSSMNLAQANREQTLAYEAARARIEEMQDGDFADVFARFNSDPSDDPLGAGSAEGSDFSVAGLDPVPDDGDGLIGEIVFPGIDVGGGDLELQETQVLPELGMPHDLNGDGVPDSADRSGDYALLPVLVRVEWRGKSGTNKVEIKTILSDR